MSSERRAADFPAMLGTSARFMITTLGLGFVTPPFGLNLFAMSGLTRTPVGAIAREAAPFVFAMILISALIGFVPQISLFALSR